MQLTYTLLLCQFPNGAFSAMLPSYPSIHVFGATRDGVLKAATEQLEEQLKWNSETVGPIGIEPTPILHKVSISVPRADAETLVIPVTLLAAPVNGDGMERYLVTAPRLKALQLFVEGKDQIEQTSIAELERLLARKKPQKLLKISPPGEETLEVVQISLPSEDGEGSAPTSDDDESLEAPAEDAGPEPDEDVVSACGSDMSTLAAKGNLTPAIHREALVDRLLAVLADDRNGSAILVGPGDVGKTAVIHSAVCRIAAGEAPSALKGVTVWSVTANSLIAGQSHTGEWQGRVQQLIRQARHQRLVLYMGDPGQIIDAGRWSKSDNNMSRYLRPYMESGHLRLICECSPEVFAAEAQHEPSFMNAFQRIDVEACSEVETLTILQDLARRAEADSPGEAPATVEPAALDTVLDLTRRFFPYRGNPGKAVRLLREALQSKPAEQEAGGTSRTLGPGGVVAALTRATGLPNLLLDDAVPLRLGAMREYFEARLLGQPEAVDAMVDLVTILKAALNDPQKPLGSFFFIGPTGVGKTEMAKVLAEFLFGSRDRLLRFDMSEYAAEDALPRLIGSAWTNDARHGELTRRVREQPFSVVLLDEIEKGHPDVFDALLGVLGEGRLSNAAGGTTDFRNSIVIMTSNLGSGRRETQALGFGPNGPTGDGDGASVDHYVKEMERFFRPEFFNRIDRIVTFRPLSLDAVRRIARRELGRLLMRQGIVRRNLLVELDDAVVERLVEKGFHRLYGARPLQREIERAVILPLARLLVEEGAGSGQLLRFTVRAGEIHLSLVPLETPEPQVTAAPQFPIDRRLESDLAKVKRTVEQLRESLVGEQAGPVVQRLRGEVSRHLERTREPTFWDRSEEAKTVMARVYQLERVLRRLDDLVSRAEVLEERVRASRRRRDRSGLPALVQSVERLEESLAVLRVEIAGAVLEGRHDYAYVRVSTVGPASDAWAQRLLAMYGAWAGRKGYGVREEPGGLHIEGVGVFELLRGEAGLHKLQSGSGDEKQRQLARVTVRGLPAEGESPTSSEADTAVEAVARVYMDGRHRQVRDPRTGARSADIEGVLNRGRIDLFLISMLQREAARAG